MAAIKPPPANFHHDDWDDMLPTGRPPTMNYIDQFTYKWRERFDFEALVESCVIWFVVWLGTNNYWFSFGIGLAVWFLSRRLVAIERKVCSTNICMDDIYTKLSDDQSKGTNQ